VVVPIGTFNEQRRQSWFRLLGNLLAGLMLVALPVGAAPDLDLRDLLERALQENLGLKVEKLQVQERALEERKAGNALIPNLDGHLTHNRQAYVDRSPFSLFGSQYYSTVFSMELVQRYPALGKIPRLQREVANLRIRMQETATRRAEMELWHRLIQRYFEYLKELELEKIDTENIGLLKRLHDVAEINRGVGIALPNDILRIEAEQANVEASRVEHVFLAQNIRIDIANMLNLSDAASLSMALPATFSFLPVTLDRSALERAMLERDEELELASQDCRIYETAVRGARAAKLPELSVTSRYNWSNAGKMISYSRDYSFNVGLDFPIFDSGDLKNDLQKAETVLQRLEVSRAKLIQDKRATLNRSWTDYQEMLSKLQFSQKAVEQSRENMRMVMIRYEHGDATVVELVDARLTLSGAAQNSIKTAHDERVRLAELYFLSRDVEALKTLDKGVCP